MDFGEKKINAPIQDAIFIPANTGKSLQIFGATIIIKVYSESVNNAYSVFEISSPAGIGTPAHVHHRDSELD